MDGTPKLQRKVSLSLGNKLQRKRHSDSPQNRLRVGSTTEVDINLSHAEPLDEVSPERPPRSPSVMSVISECNTPPHRNSLSLDDSFEFSPKLMDTSLSPSILFSQTLISNSPEVDWRWSRQCGRESNPTTENHDYYEDSIESIAPTKHRRRLPLLSFRNNQRKQELEMRRAQESRVHELLKQRCEKFHKQLEESRESKLLVTKDSEKSDQRALKNDKSVATKTKTESQAYKSSKTRSNNSSTELCEMNPRSPNLEPQSRKSPVPEKKSNLSNAEHKDVVNDFFNDSDMDCFLLEATQKLESEIVMLSQPTNIKKAPEAVAKYPNKDTTRTLTSPSTARITTPTSHKEKRSSLYMQFLEEETPDEWFTALDDAVREATQLKKPRTSLQRYKSMPAATTTSNSTATTATKPASTAAFSGNCNTNTTQTSSGNSSRLKRHASTHAFSPLARGKLFGSRK